jgi:hypothetical protein
MHSEPIEDIQKASTTKNSSESSHNQHHGYPSHDQQLPLPLLSGESGDDTRSGHYLHSSDASGSSGQSSPDVQLAGLRNEQGMLREKSNLESITTIKDRGNDLENIGNQDLLGPESSSDTLREAPINAIPNGKDGHPFRDLELTACAEILTHILSHLPPASLSAVALVSKRFHDLVTTPHAWRIAFSRFFPGPDALHIAQDVRSKAGTAEKGTTMEAVKTERRHFDRLTALASWRSEYILRTRLLRSLSRGKPGQDFHGSTGSSRVGSGLATAVRTYNTGMTTTINHIHATFDGISSKKRPRMVHGADEMGTASTSDPTTGKVENWGFRDPQTFWQFADRFPGDAQWGLGAGDVIGVPNVMDVSQPYGMVHGEGSPGGSVYYRSVEEMRGRFLAFSIAVSDPKCGIPRIQGAKESICAVWIAKTSGIVSSSDGLIGILSGSSFGVLTAYSLGTNGSRGPRLSRGEITARWVLSPGVPIISVAVDDTTAIKASGIKIWAVALNALGEVFYLKNIPRRESTAFDLKLDESGLEHLAWETGRSVAWQLLEWTRRKARPDPYHDSEFDGSYSPRSSWNAMDLSKEQVSAETKEIEQFLDFKPKHFQHICEGWDMRRRLEVDFAGSTGGTGEAVIILECGLEEETFPHITRYTRCQLDLQTNPFGSTSRTSSASHSPPRQSLFGDGTSPRSAGSYSSSSNRVNSPDSSRYDLESAADIHEEWKTSVFDMTQIKTSQITVSTLDMSTFARLSASEDPLLKMSASSTTSSPVETPARNSNDPPSANNIPGQRARYLAVGTSNGIVILWNIRAAVAKSAGITNTLLPLRVIHTDSPQISGLALSALYLVHGGSDGLVQAWDPLASNLQPIRTLNSRFSSRARRRLVQAAGSPQGVGINLFAAGAICLDPDPTKLRGVVALGSHVRLWHYSSVDADQYSGRKRRLRRSPRSSNQNSDRFSGTGRSALKDYIANERQELENDKKEKRREENRLAGRFGIGLLGQGEIEEDVLAYARMLSEETFQQDEERRKSESDGFSGDSTSVWSSDTITPEGSVALETSSPMLDNAEDIDGEMAEAIRLSLLEDSRVSSFASSGRSDIPFRYAKSRRSPSSSPPRGSSKPGSARTDSLEADLDFAMQLSLAEEKSKMELSGRDLSPEKKGKGRAH